MKSAYVLFYLEGREERLLKNEIDVGELAARVMDDKGSIHDIVHKAVSDAAKPLELDRKKKQWVEDYEDAIKEAGGDANEAYRHYLDGRIDELTCRLEGEVLEDLIALDSGDEDDEEEEDEDEEDDAEEGD